MRAVPLPRRAVLAASVLAVAIAALALLGAGHRAPGSPAAVWGVTLPIVAGAGLADGFNPCSFSGLIVFASFAMAAAQKGATGVAVAAPALHSRRRLLGSGLTYVSAVFLVYVALGLGFLASVNVLSQSHIVGKIAALVTMALGLWTLKDVLVPEWGWRLEVPRFLRPRVRTSVRATTPAAVFAAGVVVGLCTVPCTGGVYLGILALLAAQPTYGTGLAYLLLYNVMFVAPLLGVLTVASSRRALGRIARWQTRSHSTVKLALGLVMVGLGLLSLALLT